MKGDKGMTRQQQQAALLLNSMSKEERNETILDVININSNDDDRIEVQDKEEFFRTVLDAADEIGIPLEFTREDLQMLGIWIADNAFDM